MKNILTIAKRELWSYLNTPIAYIVTVAFWVPINFLFWRQALMANEANLRGFFSLLPWFLLLVVPALTMRALADEQRKNTLELLLSHALQEWQVVVGKFLGMWGFYCLLLAITSSLPFTLLRFGNPDVGIIIGQYIGALLMGAALIAMGIAVSTWFTQAVTAFLVTAGVGFIWYLLGLDMVTLALPWPANLLAHQLAILPHVEQIARGVVELRDAGYFLSVTAVLLALAGIKLSEAKLVENPVKRSQLYTGALLIAALGVVLNVVFTAWPWRLDMTVDKRFTMSAGTLTTLKNLPDIVSITFYVSRNLPAQVQITRRDVEDTLRDYTRYGQGKLKTTIVNPETSPEAQQQAAQAGVDQIQFNTIGSGKFAVEAGYIGLVINYGDKKETIGYVQDPGNLEYELTQRIRKLTSTEKREVGFLTGQGEKGLFEDLSQWSQEINKQFATTSLSLTKASDQTTSRVVVVAGPTSSLEATASGKLKDFVNNQGKVLLLIDAVQANPQMGVAQELETGWNAWLTDWGLKINQDLAYDVQLNENVRMGQGFVQYIVPYPFWVRSLPASANVFPVPEGVLLGWPSSINIEAKDGVTASKLLQTSKAGGRQEGVLTIAPDKAPKQGKGEQVLMAAAAEKNGSRVVLVSDSELATNDFYANSPANQVFLANALDWLMADEALAQVKRRVSVPALLKFNSPTDALAAQYGNLIGVPMIVGVLGFWWLRRRSQLTKREYRL